MQKAKYTLALLANYIPVFIAYVLYELGIDIGLVVFCFQILLWCLNYDVSKSRFSLAFLNLNLLISTYISFGLSTTLYYNNISSDGLTLAIGQLIQLIGSIFVLVVSVILVLVKKPDK